MDGLLFILENIIFDHTSSFTNILSVIISSFKLLYKMQCSCIIYSRQFCQTVPIISLDVGSFRKKIEHCYCIKLQNYYTNSFQSILSSKSLINPLLVLKPPTESSNLILSSSLMPVGRTS